ncbi:MAG: beta-N-acetylhexosaminidase [Bacteroidales bacterium]|nr:beta-N-acetylhexosaminidase [Bacteroidales bacterium]
MKLLNIKIIIIAGLLAVSCAGHDNVELGIIPAPQNVVSSGNGSFNMAGASFAAGEGISPRAIDAIRTFAEDLSSSTGVPSSVGTKGSIRFKVDTTLGDEAYSISIKRKGITIEYATDKGVMYAISTLRQLLPVENYVGKPAPDAKWELPCVKICDQPRFGYRGLLLDCGRHYFSTGEIKKCLDIMSVYKLNILHWHLTEDQGWRIQIDTYPLLTEKASWRKGTQVGRDKTKNDGVPYGGYYTKDEIRDIIAYADNLGIEIIPEIDLPGHMLAALSVYPELGCTGGPYEVWTRWGVSPDVLCPGKEATFEFLENVLNEVAELFPSRYVHIGGDECPKIRWQDCPDCQARINELGLVAKDDISAEQQLQCYVTSRVQDILAKKGKSIIGWDEILEGDLKEGATVMSWRGAKGGIEAAERGFKAIMCPYQYLYIDYAQVEEKDLGKEPMAMAGCLPIEKVYSFEPYEGIPDGQTGNIIGVQANLWTEYIGTDEYLEYMLLPRLAAASELQWTEVRNKNLDRVLNDIKTHQFRIYDQMGYNYSKVIMGIYGNK